MKKFPFGTLLAVDIEYEIMAVRSLHRMQPKAAENIRTRLAAIAEDPFAAHANVETIRGLKNGFRLRVGDWRAVYRVDVDNQVMQVIKIAPRGEVYR